MMSEILLFAGYGSVSPHTPWGKLVTIIYALIGIPLMLLYLSTTGEVLARVFRKLYGKLCGPHQTPPHCPCSSNIRVPVSLCLLIVLVYVCSGAVLFHKLENWSILEEDKLVEVFQQENSPVQTLFQNGVRILLALYNAPKSEDNIDHFRYTQFIKLTKLNKPVQLSTLAPTSVAAHQHINRVYYQIQTWLGKDLEPQEWGWMLENEILEPIRTLLPPAPAELLNIIFCNCKSSCGPRCGCRKSGLLCSSACGQCNGQACLNASLHPSNPDEESAYDLEILEDLEMNMTDNEDDDNELNIFERQQEEDDEEEEDD